MRTDRREIAVAIHDVEPATFERCALIRDWLDDHGIGRATLLVVPAPDLHPLQDRSHELVDWLDDRRRRGDAIAQHGLRDRRARAGCGPPFSRTRRPDAEFARLDGDEARRAVDAGHRILHLAGLEPHGFVAPGYAYTPALHAALQPRFAWWAGLTRLYRPGGPERGVALAPALSLGDARTRGRLLLSPCLVRARAASAGRVLRLDLVPQDFERPRHVGAVESVLERAHGRVPVTLDELAGELSPASGRP